MQRLENPLIPTAQSRSFSAGSGLYRPPTSANEPVLSYAPGSSEKVTLKAELEHMSTHEVELFPVIGRERVGTSRLADITMPHRHRHRLGRFHKAGKLEVERAIEAALAAQPSWAAMPWAERLGIFRRAAELLSGPYRAKINAATMLGQSKTVHQAEIDSACELIDFLRFNVDFASQIYAEQPESGGGTWNRIDYRPLEGFVFAVTPFNFTAIAGNLPTSPAMLGNVVLWKPASSAVYSAYVLMQVLEEAGMPAGVINLLCGEGPELGDPVLENRHLAGIHFTGSGATLRRLWKTMASRLEHYRTYPRVVGETGGKDFVVAHRSADPQALSAALIRGAFEYQGQKCSAASRAYLPVALWERMKYDFLEEVTTLRVGDVSDFRNFMGAVIDRAAFDKIKSYIDLANGSKECRILFGGGCDDSEGYFIQPTVVETTDPHCRLMEEEIFGPVLTIYPYAGDSYEEILELCDRTSPYALTGAVFARDREAIMQASQILRNAAGNFYVNDKPTGSVVNQQPFGGARASGTNDKAGSKGHLMRWLSPRVIKENFDPPKNYRYPFLSQA